MPLSGITQNLLHTDIKPLNIVQTTEGAWKLIDLVCDETRQ